MSLSSKLPIHEWSIILLFSMILMFVAGYAITGNNYVPLPASPLEQKNKTIMVKIEGEVAHPGPYQISSKTTLKELIAQAQPFDTADLSALNYRRKPRDGQTIQIPARKEITIQVTGAVHNPGPLKLLSSTRIHEIADKLQFTSEADVKAVQRRQSYLYEGDILEIPVKKEKKKTTKNINAKRSKKLLN